ncbi:sulfotransferase domain-containing protein [Rhodobacteraceae bacterium NNCM2]|nr:sulfotransferase domain-containing protein [Coraliihabitans acroporae]
MMSLQRIIWLASFPKSGNTWTRFFLARYFMPPDQAPTINELRKFTLADVRQDFYNRANGGPFKAESFDDWVLIRQKVLPLLAQARPGNHFVKTHCQIQRIGNYDIIMPEVTAAAIYIMRNPFDVVPSFARHMSVDIDSAIERILDPKFVNTTDTMVFELLGRWDDHIESWMNAPGLTRYVMRYEDMVANTEKSFRNLLGFLNAPVQDGQLRRAIRASSFKELQKQEKKHGFRERPAGMEQFFVKGTSGTWRESLTPAQVDKLRSEFLPTLEKYYPELVEETAAYVRGA